MISKNTAPLAMVCLSIMHAITLVQSPQDVEAKRTDTTFRLSRVRTIDLKRHRFPGSSPEINTEDWDAFLESETFEVYCRLHTDNELKDTLEIDPKQSTDIRNAAGKFEKNTNDLRERLEEYLLKHYSATNFDSIDLENLDASSKLRMEKLRRSGVREFEKFQTKVESILDSEQQKHLRRVCAERTLIRKFGRERMLRPLKLAMAMDLSGEEYNKIWHASRVALEKLVAEFELINEESVKKLLESCSSEERADLQHVLEFQKKQSELPRSTKK